MNTKSSWLGLGLGALSLLLFGNLASASPEGQPVITSVRLEGTNVVVTVQVPAGVKRVTLECRGRLGAGNWGSIATHSFCARRPWHSFERQRNRKHWAGTLAHRTIRRRCDVHRHEALPADFGLEGMITIKRK